MTVKNRGETTILQSKINHEILSSHCIIHQEALCAQTFPAEIVEVMNLVIKIVNSISSKALYHRQFKEFLNEMETQYFDLLHNKVRWLSKVAAVLFPFFSAYKIAGKYPAVALICTFTRSLAVRNRLVQGCRATGSSPYPRHYG
ncbi:general transcription factor II-I repeat domain-containing protein 2 [Trichonephila clavipes]|nr:general transcription factor II-I repeat domain-containing protein 2 [Trichonephila clavipes]